jgi:diacylglycerol O-acyltransferase
LRRGCVRRRGWRPRCGTVERFLHIDVEPVLNRQLVPHELLRTLVNYEYASTYLIAAGALLLCVYVWRPAHYRATRTSFTVLNLIGIGVFLVYPVAPPRLVPGLPFVDTVRVGHTWGSWGSPVISHANQLAAMPSLHLAWALWVSVILARVTRNRWLQVVSGLHVLGTTYVIMATANHYLLDAVGGGVLVWLATRRPRPGTVPAADAFFLHVESPIAAQHVGGLAVVDNSAGRFGQDSLRAAVQAHLSDLPRFRQRLSGGSRWRRPRWVDETEIDWNWHVPLYDLTQPDGRPGDDAALDALVAELASTRLPRDRPLWRFVAVVGVDGERGAGILVVHHVIADGIGTVAQALTMLEPRIPLPIPSQRTGPGPARLALATTVGLAQLATDGRPSFRLPTGGTANRSFATVDMPLDGVRRIAHHYRTRVSDVLLTTVAGALRRVGAVETPGRVGALRRGGVTKALHRVGAAGSGVNGSGPLLRVAIPLMVRAPGSAAEGNLTAAVMTDIPLGPLDESRRLTEIARRSRSLYTGTRAIASNFVMRRIGALMPVPLHGWFARTVYGGRFFQAIVSNMPGPTGQLSLGGGRLVGVYPILPLAPRAPLGVGALGWDGVLFVGIAADPALVPDAETLSIAMADVFAELLAGIDPEPAPTRELASTVELAPIGEPASIGELAPTGEAPTGEPAPARLVPLQNGRGIDPHPAAPTDSPTSEPAAH